MKIAVYTAIFGGKDILRDPIDYRVDEAIDYFVISDEVLQSDIYQLIKKEVFNPDITKNARYYKILGIEEFENYDYVIWHDANLQLKHDFIPELVKQVQNKHLATFLHPIRNCIYDEAATCIMDKKEDSLKLFSQCLIYFFRGMPSMAGLFETSILVKNNRLNSFDFNQLWWREIKKYSRRDQISLPYIIYRHKISIGILQGDRINSPYSMFYEHNYNEYHQNKKKRIRAIFFDKRMIKAIRLLKKLREKSHSK